MHAPAIETPLPPSPGAKPFYLKELDFGVLAQCIRCGLCLPTCPTCDATKLEKHSPRGRIQLMRNVAEGRLDLTEAFGDEMYFCLGCLACETACPAGVDYTRMFEKDRADIERAGILNTEKRNWIRSVMLRGVFTRPWLLRLIGRVLRIYQASGMETLVRVPFQSVNLSSDTSATGAPTACRSSVCRIAARCRRAGCSRAGGW